MAIPAMCQHGWLEVSDLYHAGTLVGGQEKMGCFNQRSRFALQKPISISNSPTLLLLTTVQEENTKNRRVPFRDFDPPAGGWL